MDQNEQPGNTESNTLPPWRYYDNGFQLGDGFVFDVPQGKVVVPTDRATHCQMESNSYSLAWNSASKAAIQTDADRAQFEKMEECARRSWQYHLKRESSAAPAPVQEPSVASVRGSATPRLGARGYTP